MGGLLWANLLYENYETPDGGVRTVLHAMPLLLGTLCVLAVAYRYYSAFLAARVAVLNDQRTTPAHELNDGQNYHPTNKWVLFGHHFAAIAGAGPLIGPVLAIQYGYFPGLLWLVIGVCLAGAVQDMLVLAASVRRGGKSLAEIARTELGRPAAVIVSAAILFIVIIALAGLGFVVVKALGGDEILLAPGTRIHLPSGQQPTADAEKSGERTAYRFPEGCDVVYAAGGASTHRSEAFRIEVPGNKTLVADARGTVTLPAGAQELVPGSSWGTFTIACTIPIALLMGLYLYRFRKGKVVEASLIGAAGVLAAVVIGNWVPGSPLERFFSLTKGQTILALTGYGFIASVLPVWLLLMPRDYLSSFLKIGTVGLIVVGVFVANPTLPCPAVNHTFQHGGPTFKGDLFPFLFICIMCGAVSGFHALVSSGTTPKMVDKESDVRPIGYGAMLTEGLVGIVALIVAASLPQDLYYDINTSLPDVPNYQKKLDELYASLGTRESKDPLNRVNVDTAQHLPVDLASVERMVGGEALRGRTGGAVTLAVGMAFVFSDALSWTGMSIEAVMKYWYHFAIMFEALFILTTIDAGTRIARFLLQEALGKVYPRFEQTNWLPGALLATLAVTAAWGALIWAGSISTIWPMFGIANQLLAVVALAIVTTLLINTGRARYAWVTLLPMLFVTATTMTAGAQMIGGNFPGMISAGQKLIESGPTAEQVAVGRGLVLKGWLNIGFSVFVVACVGTLLLLAVSRWVAVAAGMIPVRRGALD
ncbi:MAG TPA: carbon starvation protein A [Gemmataceae bacterium]|nr:carbon starvation protein A [Gemmataceae bacterium]